MTRLATRGRQRTSHPVKNELREFSLETLAGGGQGAQTCLGGVWQPPEITQVLNIVVKHPLSAPPTTQDGPVFACEEFTFNLSFFLLIVSLLSFCLSTAGFELLFYLCAGAADGQTSEESQHFFPEAARDRAGYVLLPSLPIWLQTK